MTIDRVKQLLNELHRKGVEIRLAIDIDNEMNFIPSGSLTLDYALGGGFPCGKSVEIYGKYSSGKSLISLNLQRNVTRNKKFVIAYDGEGNHSNRKLADYRKRFGIDERYIIQIEPQDAEDVINSHNRLLKELGPDCELSVIDSVGSLATEDALDRKAGDRGVAEVARLMSDWTRKLYVMNKHACVLFLNHQYSQISRIPMPMETKGGNALKYNAAIRLEVRGKQIPDLEDESNGTIKQEMLIHVRKNKIDRAGKIAACVFDFKSYTFDVEEELLLIGGKMGIIRVSAPMFIFEIKGKEYKFRGRENAKQFLREKPQVKDYLLRQITNG